jgi:hypothetical protein
MRGDKGFLDLGTDIEGFDTENIQNMGKNDSLSNKWQVQLTDKLPLEISVELAMGNGKLDLSGLRVSELKLEAGLADMTVIFKEPNQVIMDRFAAECGLGSMHIEELGNASTKYFKFEGGLGSAVIDLQGALPKDFRADMEVGLGSLEVHIPQGTQVKINCDCSFLSSVNFEDFTRKDDKVYLSPGFNAEKDYITLNVSVGLGSAKVSWVK